MRRPSSSGPWKSEPEKSRARNPEPRSAIRDRQRHELLLALPVDQQRDRLAAALPGTGNRRGHVLRRADLAAVDLLDDVARLQAELGGGAALGDPGDQHALDLAGDAEALPGRLRERAQAHAGAAA